MRRLLVDGMNVMGSRPDGWWSDRGGAARRLAEQLAVLAERTGDEVTVVFDGRPSAQLPPGRHAAVAVCYAPGGPDAADDRIVELLAAASDPSAVEVVTADRRLRRRVSALGARVLGPRALLEALEADEESVN